MKFRLLVKFASSFFYSNNVYTQTFAKIYYYQDVRNPEAFLRYKISSTLEVLTDIKAIELNVGDIILRDRTYVVVEEISTHMAIPVR